MGDFIIPPPSETWWVRLRRAIQQHPSARAALVSAIAVIAIAMLQHVWYANEIGELKSQLATKIAQIQELDLELLPCRTPAIQEFDKADAGALKALANAMATLQSEYSQALSKIAEQQNQIESLRLATSPRIITAEQKASLLQVLQSAPKGEVCVTADFVDAEAQSYARQIESLLQEAKYDVPDFTQSGTVTLSLGLPGSFLIVNSGTNRPSHAGPIQQAFKTVGIELQETENSDIVSVSNRAVIWIGQKP